MDDRVTGDAVSLIINGYSMSEILAEKVESGFTPVYQFLDSRPVVLYLGPDDLLRTDRNEIAEAVSGFRVASQVGERVQYQMNCLFGKIAEWVESRKSKVSGFGGMWRIQEYIAGSDIPRIKANFVIIQTLSESLDEELWVEMSRFDVQISREETFSNIRMNIMPMPFIKREALRVYLDSQFEL